MIVGVGDNPRLGLFLSSHCPVLFPFPLLNGKHHNIVTNESPKLKLDFNLRQTDINLEEVTLKTPLYSFHTANIFCVGELWLVLATKKCFIVKTEVKRKLIKNFNLYNLQKHKAPFCSYF